MNRKIKFDPDYVALGIGFIEAVKDEDTELSKHYSVAISNYLNEKQYEAPAKEIMFKEGQRILKLEEKAVMV
ncbi:hypothetical protein KAT51_07535 [bacterium]|nr:hypothetical protein [bacterium]